MARGRKPLPKDYEKLIEEATDKISRYKKRVQELEEEREQLLSAKKQKDMEKIYNKLMASGKSIDEIIGDNHVQSQPMPQEAIATPILKQPTTHKATNHTHKNTPKAK